MNNEIKSTLSDQDNFVVFVDECADMHTLSDHETKVFNHLVSMARDATIVITWRSVGKTSPLLHSMATKALNESKPVRHEPESRGKPRHTGAASQKRAAKKSHNKKERP